MKIYGPRTAGPHEAVYDYIPDTQRAWRQFGYKADVECRDCGADWKEGARFPPECRPSLRHRVRKFLERVRK